MNGPPLLGSFSTLAGVALVVALAACAGGGAGGPSVPPTAGPPAEPGLSPAPGTTAGAAPRGASASETLAVYLLGGSSARECVVSNADWSAELSRLLGREVRAVDLAETNQSFSADIRFVRAMGRRPALVLVGVGLGRFTSPPPVRLAEGPLPASGRRALAGEVEVEHGYDDRPVHAAERKRRLLDLWLAERCPLFRRHYAANLAELERLLEECRGRGFSVALLELPLDLEVVGDRLDDPRERYLSDCRRLAARHGAAFISFVDDLRLRSSDFYDLMHLGASGRAFWQERLSREVAGLLAPPGGG